MIECTVDVRTGKQVVSGNDTQIARMAMACSPIQMRIALHRADLLNTVNLAVDGDPEAKIVWEYATEIVRVSPLIDALKGNVGLSDDEIDGLFRAAMAVKV